jgi:hypothetical protein
VDAYKTVGVFMAMGFLAGVSWLARAIQPER